MTEKEKTSLEKVGINGGSFRKLVSPVIGTLNTAAYPNLLYVKSGFFVCKGESRKDLIVGMGVMEWKTN